MKHIFAFLENILKVSLTMSGNTDYQNKISLSDLESILSEFYLKLFSTFVETSNCHPKQ